MRDDTGFFRDRARPSVVVTIALRISPIFQSLSTKDTASPLPSTNSWSLIAISRFPGLILSEPIKKVVEILKILTKMSLSKNKKTYDVLITGGLYAAGHPVGIYGTRNPRQQLPCAHIQWKI